MNDQNDEIQNIALLALAAVVALVVAGVLALAVSRGLAGSAKNAPSAAVNAAALLVVGQPEGRVYFETGSAALPPDASQILVQVADAARMQSERVVLISGFHDASGDAAINADLAKRRALAVRHALEANGVAPDHLVMDKPVVMTGSSNAREARRVEMRLR